MDIRITLPKQIPNLQKQVEPLAQVGIADTKHHLIGRPETKLFANEDGLHRSWLDLLVVALRTDQEALIALTELERFKQFVTNEFASEDDVIRAADCHSRDVFQMFLA